MIYLAAVKWGGHPPVDFSHGTVECLLKPHLMAKIAGRSRSSLGRLYSNFVTHYFFSSMKKFLRYSTRRGVKPVKPTKTVLDVAAVKDAINLVNSFSVSAMEKHLSDKMPDSNVTKPVAIVGNILGVSVERTEAVNKFISSRNDLPPPKNLPKLIKWVAAARKSTHVGKWPDDLTRELETFIQAHPHVLVLCDPNVCDLDLAGVVPRNNHRVWVYKAVQCLISPPSICSTCLAGFLYILRRPSPPKLTIADLFVTLGTKA